MEFVLTLVAFIAGLIFGGVIVYVHLRHKSSGALRMHNDPDDGPYLFLELAEQPESVMKKKFVTFSVNPRDYVSQK